MDMELWMIIDAGVCLIILGAALLGAIKYNRTSSSMCNSYGLSIYFPGSRLSKVDSMVNTYRELGIDSDYARCIQQYATISASGQAATGGTHTIFDVLGGMGGSSSGSTGSYGSGSSGSYGSYGSGSYGSGWLRSSGSGWLLWLRTGSDPLRPRLAGWPWLAMV